MGKWSAIRRFFSDEWKIIYFVFIKLNESLFVLTQIVIFCSLTFTSLNSLLISLLDKNEFISSANMTGFETVDALQKP